MAKKKANKKKQLPSTSSVNTSTPIKGMIKDVDSAYFGKENWFHGRNLANNSMDGDTGVVGNEPANLACGKIPYTVIGTIHLYGDQWVIFSTDDINSEIGRFDDSKCEYITSVNDQCLNFNRDNLIIGASKENFDCTWQVYWDDNLNPSRTLNLDKIPYKQQQLTGPDVDGNPCVIYQDITPNELDCEEIRLHPLMDMACLRLEKAEEGGALYNGSYQAFIAYCDNAQTIGDYFINSNITSVWSHENTNSSIILHISDLDTDFEFFKLVIRAKVANSAVNYEFGTYSTETKKIPIDFIDPELPTILPSKLLIDNPVFEKSAGMFVVNDYLIRSQPTEYFDFNYQPLANQIATYWTTATFPDDYYRNGGNNPTFLRDEQYTFFIRFIYNTGEFSKSYHIPGRAPAPFFNGMENSTLGGINAIDGTDRVFDAYNTATFTPGDPFISSLIGTTTDDGGIITGGGKMGFWESSELYPATQPERYNSSAHPWSDPGTPEFDLCGVPIRHHKIPDESLVATDPNNPNNSCTSLYNSSNGTINVIGVAFDNIAPPVDNDGNLIENIVGYQIMVGSRDGKKSIIGKGIIKNMMRFKKDRNDNTFQGLCPNYPFNDLRIDPYLLARDSGNRANENWFSQLMGWDPDIEDNWLGGNEPDMSGSYNLGGVGGSINGPAGFGDEFIGGRDRGKFDPNTYTFHSPDTNFTKVYLNPTEVKMYKSISGPVTGRFKTVEGHTQHKLLKNKVVLLAAIYGVGYAIMKMRGERNYSLKGTRSNSVGEFGTYAAGSGTHGSPFPGAGTAYGAANVGTQAVPQFANQGIEYLEAGWVDAAAIMGGGSEGNKLHLGTQQTAHIASAALAAGHMGPEQSIQMRDSEFNATPGIGTFITGILTFLNFVAIGGDRLVQLILDLVSFQDYALKYISHGFYSNETEANPTSQFRIGIDRARYIKQAVQSFDGNVIVQNVLRPSTVVLRHKYGVKFPAPSTFDNTKFTLGAGPCAGNGNSQASWWDFGEEIDSTCSANYVSIKNQISNQYGQLDSIIQLPIFGCTTKFKNQQVYDEDGVLTPIAPGDRFSTGVLFGGDSYIARYTEKTTMPFFYQFLKDDEERGYQFNYSRYANVPFPRYWYNSEKYRMGEFVRPFTDLSFSWAGALPDALYNLDTPKNGAYCPPSVVTMINPPPLDPMGEGGMTGDDWGVGNSDSSVIFTPEGQPPNGAIVPSANSTPEYVIGAEAQRYVVHTVSNTLLTNFGYSITNGASSYTFNKQNIPLTLTYPNSTAVDQAVTQELIDAGITGAQVSITLNLSFSADVPYSIPYGTGGAGADCNIDTHINNDTGAPPAGTYFNLTDNTGGNIISQGDVTNVNIIFDWQALQVIGVTNDPNLTKYAATQYSTDSSAINPATGLPYTGTPVPINNDFSLVDFTSDVYTDVGAGGEVYSMDAGTFQVVNGFARCKDSTSNANPITGIISGYNDGPVTIGPNNTTGQENYANSVYNSSNYQGAGNAATGGLFVWKYGYIYTHNCGINDFWVETDINLAYRDWEEEKRKRHYDDEEYTDLVELFHSKIVGFDNYYNYDKSVGVRRFFGVSFSKIQERWYDPTVSEQCFTQYPKRLIYSVPATGFLDKVKLQNKNDKAIDFWRVFLAENYRDFKSKINAIVPFNQTGALMLFPTLSPKVFQGVDKLQLTQKKVMIGDGGLFAQVLQNAANSNVSHEYGSCESFRSVLNTPQGIYFVSQAQGKIFLYQAGGGLQAISDIGMKWWFNKFLPSQLLADFPEIENCPQVIDNPVMAAGINTVYDPNDDIVYFCKRDFKVRNNCIQYIPCEGFVYNATLCNDHEPSLECPEGYTFTPGGTSCPPGWQAVSCLNGSPCCIEPGSGNPPSPAIVTGDQCCQIVTIPATAHQTDGHVDIVIAVDSSNSVSDNGNIAGVTGLVNDLLEGFKNSQVTPGQIRVGIVHFGAGRASTTGALANVTLTSSADTMFNASNQLQLTDDFSGTGPLFSYMTDVYTLAAQTTDNPSGTDILAGIWSGMNMLYGQHSRPDAEKRLITIADGALHTNGTQGALYGTADIQINSGTPSPATPAITTGVVDESITGGTHDVYANPGSAAGTQWFQTNIINNANYSHQKSFFIGLNARQPVSLQPPIVDTPNANQISYFNAFANAPGDPTSEIGSTYSFYSTLQNQSSINDIVDQLVSSALPNDYWYCPDSMNCDLIMNSNPSYSNPPVCRCENCIDPVSIDTTFPVDVHDDQYFEDISWTVSFDPKSKAWISFHDWHPELTMNSINHFLTIKTEETQVPVCPPGYSWNGTECCIQVFEQTPAIVNIDEFDAATLFSDATATEQKTDIVLSIDRTGSTGAGHIVGDDGNSYPVNLGQLQMNFAQALIAQLGTQLSSGMIQMALARWSDPTDVASVITPMTNNASTLNTALNLVNFAAGGLTYYNEAVKAANLGIAGSTAARKIGIIMTDASAGVTYSNVTGFQNGNPFDSSFDEIFVVFCHPGVNFPNNLSESPCGCGNLCPPITPNNPWVDNVSPFLDWLANPTVTTPPGTTGGPAVTSDGVCFNGTNIQTANIFEVTPCSNCNTCTSCSENVAIALSEQIISCACPAGTTLDLDPNNPACADIANPPQCISSECPPGYEMFGTCNDSTNPPICRRVTCDCPPSESLGLGIPSGIVPTESGICPDVSDPTWNPDPVICTYDALSCTPPNYLVGGIWRHNVRTDLFANFYNVQYPWEVDIIETTGQTVNTLRSVEYHLESYFYSQDQLDRFHDLDYNFDEAIIYNSEQISGLLNLNLMPKNNTPLAMSFPIVNPNSIDILFTKEEQKYRFNQFWDITNDRGEFSGAITQMFQTEWNGYIINMNPANLNYNKPQHERKKFRHYFNHLILRKSAEAAMTRKMLLRLENFKLNISFR